MTRRRPTHSFDEWFSAPNYGAGYVSQHQRLNVNVPAKHSWYLTWKEVNYVWTHLTETT